MVRAEKGNIKIVPATGFEPATIGLEDLYAIQLRHAGYTHPGDFTAYPDMNHTNFMTQSMDHTLSASQQRSTPIQNPSQPLVQMQKYMLTGLTESQVRKIGEICKEREISACAVKGGLKGFHAVSICCEDALIRELESSHLLEQTRTALVLPKILRRKPPTAPASKTMRSNLIRPQPRLRRASA
jgi:hypothetical protein